MEPRKRVRFEVSAGKRVSGQTPVRARKKHRCVRFGPDGGVVEKMTTAQIRVVAAQDPHVRVRAMGGEVTSLSGSPTSVVAEMQDSENALTRLQQRVERLEASVSKEKTARKEDLKVLHEEKVATSLIVNEGFTVCLRAFCDFVVHNFMQRAGMAHLLANDRAQWLEGKGAQNFVKGGGLLKVFDRQLRIDAELLTSVKKLRAFSVSSSRGVCHLFRPVQVAFALHRLKQFNTGDNFFSFFHACFGLQAESMMELQHQGSLPEQYMLEYSIAY